MRFLITFILLYSSTSVACPELKHLETGDKAPCSGLFLNQQEESRVKKDLRDYEITKKQIKLKDLQVKDLETDRNNWKSEAQKQAEVSHSKDNDLYMGFIYGTGLTLLIMFAVGG